MLNRLFIHIFTLTAFLAGTLGPMPGMAQANDLLLPKPGTMVRLSPAANPPILKGLKVYPDNPFKFDFILDKGNSAVMPANAGIQKLIKYFLASLTTPEKDLWVNLSPYEKDRIVPGSFGQTEMGRDLLAQDYLLKQITASLIYPEDEVGKKFWQRVYAEAAEKFGTTQIPVNTFNKVWIVPEKAVVYENAAAGTAYVTESKLKVMLEEDYLAVEKNGCRPGDTFSGRCPQAGGQANKPLNAKAPQGNPGSTLARDIIREIVIPKLEHEINHGKNFAPVRQVYSSLILAAWYKKKIKDSILSTVYADRKKIAGLISLRGAAGPEAIYQKYLEAFKKGAYNYIKEEIDPITQQPIPRKYFSGGLQLAVVPRLEVRQLGPDFIPPQDGEDSAMISILVSPIRRIAQAALIGAALWGFSAGDLKALSIQSQKLLEAQNARERLSLPPLWQAQIDQQLNKILGQFVRSPQGINEAKLPHLAKFVRGRNLTLNKSSTPYDELGKALRAQFADWQKRKEGLSVQELDNWADLQIDVVQFIHDFLINGTVYSEDQRSVTKFILERSPGYNCDSMTLAAMIVAKEFGIEEIYFTFVRKNGDGKVYPIKRADGTSILHAHNLLRTIKNEWVVFDQKNKIRGARLSSIIEEVYDASGKPSFVSAAALGDKPNFRELEDLMWEEVINYLFNGFLQGNTFDLPPEDTAKLQRAEEVLAYIRKFSVLLNKNSGEGRALFNNIEKLAKIVDENKKYNANGKIIAEYNSFVQQSAAQINQAVLMFNQGRFQEVELSLASLISDIERQTPLLREKLSTISGKNLLVGGKPATVISFMEQITHNLQTAKDIRAKAASAMGKSANVPTSAPANTPTRVSSGQTDVIDAVITNINSQITEASRLFNSDKFDEALQKLKALEKYIQDNLPVISEKLKGPNILNGKELLAQVQQQLEQTKQNQKAAAHNLLNQKVDALVKKFNTDVNNPTAAVRKSVMTAVVKEAGQLLRDNPQADANQKSTLQRLHDRAREIADKAMLSGISQRGWAQAVALSVSLHLLATLPFIPEIRMFLPSISPKEAVFPQPIPVTMVMSQQTLPGAVPIEAQENTARASSQPFKVSPISGLPDSYQVTFNGAFDQGRAVDRFVFFKEHVDVKGRILTDDQLDQRLSRLEILGNSNFGERRNLFAGNNFTAEEFVEFLNEAKAQGVQLNNDEKEFAQSLVEQGLIAQNDDGTYTVRINASIISEHSQMVEMDKRTVRLHEMGHTMYEKDQLYRQNIGSMWGSIDPQLKEVLGLLLDNIGYHSSVHEKEAAEYLADPRLLMTHIKTIKETATVFDPSNQKTAEARQKAAEVAVRILEQRNTPYPGYYLTDSMVKALEDVTVKVIENKNAAFERAGHQDRMDTMPANFYKGPVSVFQGPAIYGSTHVLKYPTFQGARADIISKMEKDPEVTPAQRQKGRAALDQFITKNTHDPRDTFSVMLSGDNKWEIVLVRKHNQVSLQSTAEQRVAGLSGRNKENLPVYLSAVRQALQTRQWTNKEELELEGTADLQGEKFGLRIESYVSTTTFSAGKQEVEKRTEWNISVTLSKPQRESSWSGNIGGSATAADPLQAFDEAVQDLQERLLRNGIRTVPGGNPGAVTIEQVLPQWQEALAAAGPSNRTVSLLRQVRLRDGRLLDLHLIQNRDEYSQGYETRLGLEKPVPDSISGTIVDGMGVKITGSPTRDKGLEAAWAKLQARLNDKAMQTAVSEDEVGGIDFNSDKLPLQVQNGGPQIKFRIDPAMLQELQNAPGFDPVITNIQPVVDLRLFLGLPARN